jgi:ATP-dependent DNA ligase
MKPYPTFQYLFPPRPEVKAPPTIIKQWEDKQFIAQPKLNGSCAVLFTDGNEVIMMNRHKEKFSRELLINKEELKKLHRGVGWLVLTGEYMNKSKKDSTGKVFNGKFVIFDILVYNGEYLTTTTFEHRQTLLDTLYELRHFDKFISEITSQLYRVNNIKTNITESWHDIVKTDMYEGFVLKKPSGMLETGFNSNNNTGWQVKIRKPTKNYKY